MNYKILDINDIRKWWRMLDRTLFFSFLLLIFIGTIVVSASAPMIASKIGLDRFYFVKRHLLYVIPSILVMLGISILSTNTVKYLCYLLFIISIMAVFCTYFSNYEIKGAKRWIYVLGMSVQPSEFLKPSFAVVCAFLFSEKYNPEKHNKENFPGNFISIFLMLLIGIMLFFQPDFGMLTVTFCVWFAQFFLSGLSIFFVIFSFISFIILFIFAYIFLPHVAVRVDKFLDKDIGDHFQIDKSMEAFASGGWFGVGPGEGIVKKHLPDAHADFAFAVLGEEFGFIICFIIILLFAFIIIRVCIIASKTNNLFHMLVLIGVIFQFTAQTIINISSSLHLIPTKGMTLPFISYGGSSMIATSFAAGIVLCFCKRGVIYLKK